MTDQTLANHFNDYFSIAIADTIELKKAVYKLRYDVYFTELGYEKSSYQSIYPVVDFDFVF